MQTNGIHPGDVRLASAIAAGVPIPATAAQAAELVAHENASAAANADAVAASIKCSRCDTMMAKAFGHRACGPTCRRCETGLIAADAREYVQTQLAAFVMSDAPYSVSEWRWGAWMRQMLECYRVGHRPGYAAETRATCPTCDIDMERQACELSADPEDGRVEYRSVCPCCEKEIGEGDEA